MHRLLRGRHADVAGRQAEDLAAAALQAEGWQIVARRARTEAGEIDIIATRDALLAFVEVKARPSFTEAAFALGRRQRARLMAAAEAWLAVNAGYGTAGIRFDVILVAADGALRCITDAFRLGDA